MRLKDRKKTVFPVKNYCQPWKPENTAGTPADASMEPSESAKAAESRESAEPAESVDSAQDICIRIRMRLAKYGPMKFIGHLELMRFLQKCLRRTDIEVHYSDGITPRMIMSTAMPPSMSGYLSRDAFASK